MDNIDVFVYRLEKAEEQIVQLNEELIEAKKEHNDAMTALQKEHDKRERQRLLWGIGTLGTIVSTLIGIIWSYRSEIFK